MGVVDVQQTHFGCECGDGIDTSAAVVAAGIAARRHGRFPFIVLLLLVLLLLLQFVVGVTRFRNNGANHFGKSRKTDHPRIRKNVRIGNQLTNQFVENDFHSALLAFVKRFHRGEFVKRTSELIGNCLTFKSWNLFSIQIFNYKILNWKIWNRFELPVVCVGDRVDWPLNISANWKVISIGFHELVRNFLNLLANRRQGKRYSFQGNYLPAMKSFHLLL